MRLVKLRSGRTRWGGSLIQELVSWEEESVDRYAGRETQDSGVAVSPVPGSPGIVSSHQKPAERQGPTGPQGLQEAPTGPHLRFHLLAAKNCSRSLHATV